MKTLKALKLPMIATLIGLLIGGCVIAFSGFNPIEAIVGMFKGGFGSTYYLTTTLTRATPIIFAGLAGALAWGSGYPSLGAAGQMVMGAMMAAIVAIVCPGPDAFVLVMSLAAGVGAGMAYSLLSIYISQRFQLYLLIITLMLNYIADYIASYLTSYVVKDPNGLDSSAIQTQIIEGATLPRLLEGYTLHFGFVLAIIAVLLIFFMMKKTTFGYKAKMGGLNPEFANYGGIKSTRMMYYVLLLSGAIAGIGGACEVLGTRYRYVDGMITSPGYAWSGIIASLMSSNHPIGILVSAIFLAGLTTGGSAIERSMGVPSEVTIIIQGIITLLITAKFTIKWMKKDGSSNKAKNKAKKENS
ncbi:MAG: ABC transporter permease [Cellulosilyticaceae bacterium]